MTGKRAVRVRTSTPITAGKRNIPKHTRYVGGVAAGVAALYTAFVLVNTVIVGATSLVPLPWLETWLYVQDALDIIAASTLIFTGAAVLDRLLARDQAVQSATLDGMARVTGLARRIAETGDFRARVPVDGPAASDVKGKRATGATAPPDVAELAATFNAMLERLEAAFEAQRRLLADTSHELRNPLTVLRTNLALVQREDADPQMRTEAAREAEEETARLGKLVDDLLLLGRGMTGDFLDRRPVRLDRLLADVAGEARDARTGHALELDWCPEVTVHGDAERLRQVLRNIVGNALHHTPAGTSIHLTLRHTLDGAELIVADNGPGIPAEHLPRVFDRFYRVDTARSRGAATVRAGEAHGAGLGLSIVKHLVEAHGGTVTLESVTGRGTTVRLLLPALPPFSSN
ncbi:MAG: hypothetical protein HY332_01800 [Chloroflexi bacterium]|nr:hypothetical protein [Chloroflexota bacterium]